MEINSEKNFLFFAAPNLSKENMENCSGTIFL